VVPELLELARLAVLIAALIVLRLDGFKLTLRGLLIGD
jgi:hypothetical protein